MDEIPHSEDERPVEWADVFYTGIFRAKVLLKRFWWVFLITISLGIGIQAYRELKREPRFKSYAQMIVSGRVALPESAFYIEELSTSLNHLTRCGKEKVKKDLLSVAKKITKSGDMK